MPQDPSQKHKHNATPHNTFLRLKFSLIISAFLLFVLSNHSFFFRTNTIAIASMGGYHIGQGVEVCSKEEGFEGSFYAAKILRQVDPKSYQVEYKNLLTEDESSNLIETVSSSEIRPQPPLPPIWTRFQMGDTVDVFHNDGWWVGRLTARKEGNYYVYFETTGEVIAYPIRRLRNHHDWVGGRWVSGKLGSKKMRTC